MAIFKKRFQQYYTSLKPISKWMLTEKKEVLYLFYRQGWKDSRKELEKKNKNE